MKTWEVPFKDTLLEFTQPVCGLLHIRNYSARIFQENLRQIALILSPPTMVMALLQTIKRPGKLLQEGVKTTCRALGLNVVFPFFHFLRYHTVGKGYNEQTKIAIRRSRTTALLRALIHIFPVSVAIWEIVLNWNTYFVGYDVYNQAYYQFGAKLHEIAIEASLSAVIFSCVRYELLLGDGIPFGALFSGLQVAQVSYLWSMEFWGTVCSKNGPSNSKLRFLVVVTASVFLAAVAGPSSAILLVPKLDYWPAGSTDIWINITSDSLWPARLANPFLYCNTYIACTNFLLALMHLMCQFNALMQIPRIFTLLHVLHMAGKRFKTLFTLQSTV